ncbi:MAG: APC family permease [Candidatus Bathyarchaeia archaeon]
MAGKQETKRELGLFYGVITGLGSAFGIEFFVLLEYSVQLAGPAIVLSLFLCGLINLLTMFNYSELGSSISRVGAEYTFTKVAFGGFISFLTGWLRWLSSVLTATLSAMGFAQIVQYFLPSVNTSLIAVLVIVLFTLVSVKGGKTVNLITVVMFIAVFAILNVFGIIRGLNLENFHPFAPKGYSGVFAGVMYTFGMYVGMRAIVTRSPVMKDPGRVLPKAVTLSTIVLIIVYCSVAFVVVGVVPPNTELPEPLLMYATKMIMGPPGEVLLTIAWISAALMSLATSMTVQASILSGLSRDGYLPRLIFSRDSRSGTRYIAVTIGAVLAILFAATGLIIFVGYAAGFVSLVILALVNLSLIKLRRERPRLQRPFKTPFYPYTPIIGIIFAFLLIIFVESSAIIVGLEFIIISVIVYHLRMMGYNRLRLAVGGINIGITGLTALILCLLQIGFIQLALPPRIERIFIISTVILATVFFVAGILNLAVRKKQRTMSR